jgi:hypothetical protein
MGGKRLIILAILFCALLSYVFLVEEKKTEQEIRPGSDLVKVFSIPQEKISEIDVVHGSSRAVLRNADDGWQVSRLQGPDKRQELVQSLVSSIIGLVKVEVVDETPTDIAQYGLEDPIITVTLILKSKAPPVRLLVGNESPTGISLYAMVEGENTVILIGSYLRFSINTFFVDSKNN